MSKKRKDRLLLNLLDDKKYKHRVAMVNEESGWNQHEPNSGMARMFVIMLLIHVVVIGGIIIYDFMNGDEAPTTALARDRDYSPATTSSLASSSNAAVLEKEMPIEEYATYEWRSGDSLPLVAQKLGVAEEVLIKLNMLDQGTQIDQHTIIRFPRKPTVKALALNVTPGETGVAKVAVVAEAPPAPAVEETKEVAPMTLTPPGETFTFEPTIASRLTPTPTIAPERAVQESPPPAIAIKEEPPAASPTPVLSLAPSLPKAPEKAAEPVVAKVQEQAPEKLPEVPKALPVPRQVIHASQTANEKPKPAVKKIADQPPAAKPEASAKPGSYVVKSGDTLYRIASKNGISVATLQKANNITKPDSLREGSKLVIPAK